MKTELTTDNAQVQISEREFLKYTFFKLDPEWRRITEAEKAAHKEQFVSIVENYSKRIILKSYSLMGTRGDADFMFWTTSRRLEDFQELLSSLLASGLGKYLQTPYSYLAITRQSEYLGGHHHEGQEGVSLSQRPGDSKYLFVYPFTMKREWYFLPHEERRVAMAQHFKIGHKYPSVRIHTGYSFGLDDQEFVLAFETDNAADLSELVMELRSSEASRYTALEVPLFTCVAMSIIELISLLG
jgi:chlorite dismutase